MNVRVVVTAAVLASLFITTGCAAPEVANPDPTRAPAAATAPERPPELPQLDSSPTGDVATFQGQQDALSAAEATMTAFVDRALPYEQWWAQLSPHLTPEAQQAWAYTDPRLIPATAITGAPSIVNAASSTLIVVDVPTDIGAWRLELVSATEVGAGPGAWQAFTLRPPETE